MNPDVFDKKLRELRQIDERLKRCDSDTPMSTVMADLKKAQQLYQQLSEAISEFKTEAL